MLIRYSILQHPKKVFIRIFFAGHQRSHAEMPLTCRHAFENRRTTFGHGAATARKEALLGRYRTVTVGVFEFFLEFWTEICGRRLLQKRHCRQYVCGETTHLRTSRSCSSWRVMETHSQAVDGAFCYFLHSLGRQHIDSFASAQKHCIPAPQSRVRRAATAVLCSA